MKLQGKVAYVTGASSGIGKAAAMLLASQGAKVAALSRGVDELQQAVKEIGRAGETMAIAGDVSRDEDMQRAIVQIEQKWGRLDIVFANAGINGVWAPIEDLRAEEFDKTIAINLRGTFLTIKHAVPLLKRQGGSIIIDSSINGTRVFSNIGATAYSCSKAAQSAMGKMLALELAKSKIRVNTICPGAIGTGIEGSMERRNLEGVGPAKVYPEGGIPLTGGRPGTAEEVAQLVLFLASDDSQHISGTDIFIDGGESLLIG